MIPLAASLLLAGAGTALLVAPLGCMLRDGGASRTNYRGRAVPTAGGMAVLLGVSAGAIPWLLAGGTGRGPWAVLLAWWGLALLGLLDDMAGNRQARGFGGHGRSLARGRVSTGALKAAGGLLICLLAALAWTGGWEALARGTVAALAANAVNLLDVRPGRAGKGYLAGLLLLLPALRGEALFVLLLPAAAWLGFLHGELREEIMLGDTGANLLGVSLGLGAGLALSPSWLALAGGMLLLLNLYCERRSLSELILRHPWLDRLDRLGRLDGR